jgi:hypothetical protein
MKENREFERIRTAHYLRVYDNADDKYLGHVYDISASGMRIIGEMKFEIGTKFHLKIRLPEEGILGDSIVILAEIRWSTLNETINLFESGFQFKETANVAVFAVKTLINDILQKPNEM